MTSTRKYSIINIILGVTAGVMSLIGLTIILSLTTCFFQKPEDGTFLSDRPALHVGEESQHTHAARLVALPAQTEPDLPMVLENVGLDYTYAVLFRAPVDWQETFCKLYGHPADTSFSGALNSIRHMAEKASDKRLLNLLNSKTWQHFHTSRRIAGRSEFIEAFRDESGEYLLLFLYSI